MGIIISHVEDKRTEHRELSTSSKMTELLSTGLGYVFVINGETLPSKHSHIYMKFCDYNILNSIFSMLLL